MTLEEFSRVITTRIPTPAEFVAFVEGMGWRIETNGGDRASLRASASDPLAVGLARMLGREPYRTNVLALAQQKWRQKEEPQPIPEESKERLREWVWTNEEHHYIETPDNEWLYGHPERHPVGAIRWRYLGETQWHDITREEGNGPNTRGIQPALPGTDAPLPGGSLVEPEGSSL